MKVATIGFLVAALVMACGDDSGTPADGGPQPDVPSTDSASADIAAVDAGGGERNDLISSLSGEEARAECESFLGRIGGPAMEFECEGGLTITNSTVDECVMSFEEATCSNTLADVDACAAALGGNPCGILSEASCAFFLACAQGDP